MKKLPTTLAIGSLLLLASSTVRAQSGASHSASDGKDVIESKQTVPTSAPLSATDDDWHFSLTPYLWLPGPDVTIHTNNTIAGKPANGTLHLNKSWPDVLGKLGSSFTILSADMRFEMSKGKWGAFLDGYWLYLRAKQSGDASNFALNDHVDLIRAHSLSNTSQVAQLNFAARYLLGTIPFDQSGDFAAGFEIYGGGRVNYLSNKLSGAASLGPAGAPTLLSAYYTGSQSSTYVEPMLGIKSTWKLGSHFIGMVRGDVGGFGLVEHNNTDCDLEAGIGWEFHKNTYFDLGYRARGQWQDVRGGNLSMSGWFHGPEAGITFNW